jgi:hypothetical protein
VSFLRDDNISLGDAKSLLGDAESSLGDAKSSLGDAKSLLGDAKCSLGDAESSLGDAVSSLGDAKSSLCDAESLLGDSLLDTLTCSCLQLCEMRGVPFSSVDDSGRNEHVNMLASAAGSARPAPGTTPPEEWFRVLPLRP